MSWLDLIKTQLSITTGDGEVYTPEWLNAKKAVDYNVAQFEFPETAGSLVHRGTPKGTKYNVEFYFQGPDHLSDAQAFQDSAADSRPWTLQHPFYGQLLVQPISLEFDNSKLNVSKISGIVIETINLDAPVGNNNPTDVISMDAVSCAQIFSTNAADNSIITKVPPAAVSTKSINKLLAQLRAFEQQVANAVQQATADFQDYYNTFSQAYNMVNNLITDASDVLNILQAVINKPAMFVLDIKSRLTMLTGQFNTLRQTLSGTMSNLDKLLYCTNAGGCIGAMCLATGNPQPGDYTYATDTLSTIELLLGNYNQYIVDLDFMQTLNGGNTTSFVPDHDSLVALEELVNYTISNLLVIALSGQQQRSFVLEADSNWIVLTNRLYGLDTADANLTVLMQQNNVGLNTILIVPKNTKIIYYV